MVNLVLEAPTEQFVRCFLIRVAVLVEGANRHLERPRDVTVDVRYGKASLFRFFRRAGCSEDLRIDQRELLSLDVDDREPLSASNLGSGEPHAPGGGQLS